MKRLAALLLAVVLLVSTGSAASLRTALTDIDHVTNREAVMLMTDLGIVNGKEDGSFAPGDLVDRATMAKLIYAVMMGDVDPDLFKGTNTGLTDVAGTWAEGYINYCHSVGIISGSGDGTFRPTEGVSVASAAKMLLVALGFDSKNRGYEGDGFWADNIMRDAKTVGLLKGVGQYSFEPLNRDNAAQMIYNALFAQTRTATYGFVEGEKAVKGYVVNATTLGLETMGLLRCTFRFGDVTSSPGEPELSGMKTNPTAKRVANSGAVLDSIRYGGIPVGPEWATQEACVYVKGDYTVDPDKGEIDLVTFRGLASQQIYPRESSVMAVSAAGVPFYTKAGTGLSDQTEGNVNFLALADEDPVLRYFCNGRLVTADAANETAALRGVPVEFLDTDGDKKADIARLTVKSVGTVEAVPERRTFENAVQMRIPGVPGLEDWRTALKVSGYEELRLGDVVLSAVLGDAVRLYRATEDSGLVSAVRGEQGDRSLCIDGVWYALSQLPGAVAPEDDWSAGGPCRFWLDEGGFLVRVERNLD